MTRKEHGLLGPFLVSHCPSVLGELSPCRVNNGGCQDLCLLTPKGHVNCSCRGERVLQEDFTCKGEEGRRGRGKGRAEADLSLAELTFPCSVQL